MHFHSFSYDIHGTYYLYIMAIKYAFNTNNRESFLYSEVKKRIKYSLIFPKEVK